MPQTEHLGINWVPLMKENDVSSELEMKFISVENQ